MKDECNDVFDHIRSSKLVMDNILSLMASDLTIGSTYGQTLFRRSDA